MIEKILKEINRLKNELDGYSASEALDYIEAYINTLPKEPDCKDLEKEYEKYFKTHETDIVLNPYTNCRDIARHFAKWGRN